MKTTETQQIQIQKGSLLPVWFLYGKSCRLRSSLINCVLKSFCWEHESQHCALCKEVQSTVTNKMMNHDTLLLNRTNISLCLKADTQGCSSTGTFIYTWKTTTRHFCSQTYTELFLNQSGTVFSFLDDKASLFLKKTWTNNELDKSYVKSEPYLQHPVLSRSNCCRCRPMVTHCMSLWEQSHTVCCSLSHWQLIYSVFKVWGRGGRVLMKLRFQSKII